MKVRSQPHIATLKFKMQSKPIVQKLKMMKKIIAKSKVRSKVKQRMKKVTSKQQYKLNRS